MKSLILIATYFEVGKDAFHLDTVFELLTITKVHQHNADAHNNCFGTRRTCTLLLVCPKMDRLLSNVCMLHISHIYPP